MYVCSLQMADRLPNVLANDVRERRMRELPSHILCLSGCSPLRRGESSSCVMPCAHGWTCCDGSCKHSSVARSVDGPLALRQAQKSIQDIACCPRCPDPSCRVHSVCENLFEVLLLCPLFWAATNYFKGFLILAFTPGAWGSPCVWVR